MQVREVIKSARLICRSYNINPLDVSVMFRNDLDGYDCIVLLVTHMYRGLEIREIEVVIDAVSKPLTCKRLLHQLRGALICETISILQ